MFFLQSPDAGLTLLWLHYPAVVPPPPQFCESLLTEYECWIERAVAALIAAEKWRCFKLLDWESCMLLQSQPFFDLVCHTMEGGGYFFLMLDLGG